MLGVVKEMGKPVILTILVVVFCEFATIICLDSPDDKRSHLKKLIEEIITVSRRVGCVGISEGKAGVHINGSEDIAFQTSHEDGNCIHLYQVAR